jgi:hypothetical protein
MTSFAAFLKRHFKIRTYEKNGIKRGANSGYEKAESGSQIVEDGEQRTGGGVISNNKYRISKLKGHRIYTKNIKFGIM